MEFKNNFVPLRMWFDTASGYMVDPGLKIHLVWGTPRQDPSEYFFHVNSYYDPETQRDRLTHIVTVENSRGGYIGSSLGKSTISQSKEMRRVANIDFDCNPAFQNRRNGEFVIKCTLEEENFKREGRLLSRQNVPIVSANAEAFLIHMLHVMTEFETWDEEVGRCKADPFFEVSPTKLVFVVKKSFAACISAVTGERFEDFGKDEVIFLKREGRL
jgi:hypothetical protein